MILLSFTKVSLTRADCTNSPVGRACSRCTSCMQTHSILLALWLSSYTRLVGLLVSVVFHVLLILCVLNAAAFCSVSAQHLTFLFQLFINRHVILMWWCCDLLTITSVVHVNRTRSPTPIICWIENFGGFWLFVCMLQACWQLREISDSWWTRDSQASPAVLFRPAYNWFLSCSSNLNRLDALKKERTDNGEWCTISTMRHAAVKIV